MLRRCLIHLCAVPAVASVYGKIFSVTGRAWCRVTEKNAEEGFRNDQRYLRLAIDSGGCHGFLYKFSFEPMEQFVAEEDIMVTETEVVPEDAQRSSSNGPAPRVVVDKISIGKLENAILDYHSELKGAAFVVVGNDLVDQSCACAMSFSLRKKK